MSAETRPASRLLSIERRGVATCPARPTRPPGTLAFAAQKDLAACMAWEAQRASAERDAAIAAFVAAAPFVHWRTRRRLAAAIAILLACQVLPALFLLAMWNKDRLGVLICFGAVDVLGLAYGAWFVWRPQSFAGAAGRVQHPGAVDPAKWNPWLGGGA